MAGWEEIRRLAADLQRIQLSGPSSRLSERSCIEIIQKLIELKVVDVIYTIDGKEYLTPQELGKEIREELIVRGGRVNLVDLQQAIKVDLSHIETKVNELMKADKNLTLILGQLIDRTYLDSLAEEVNDKLQQQGLVTFAELTKVYGLPGDFISQVIHARLGTIIKAQADDGDRSVLYTAQFVSQHRARIRGAFSAVTRPTPVSSIISQYHLQEKLCLKILDELSNCGRLAGLLSGGRQEKSVFIPDVFTRSQIEWVESFLKQNGYLDYDAMTRLGISEPKSFVKKRFENEEIEFLESCCIRKPICERVEAELDEICNSGGWLDIMPLLPSSCSPGDANLLLRKLVKTRPSAIVFCDCFVVSDSFMTKCSDLFEQPIKAKAEKAVQENPSLLLSSPDSDRKGASHTTKSEEVASQKDDKKDVRRKKATVGKSGYGTQGREVKTKAVKKKFGHGKDRAEYDSEEETPVASKSTEHEFMTISEITEELGKLADFSEIPDKLISGVAMALHRPLTQKYMDELKSVFLQTMQATSSSTTRRRGHAELSDKVSGLWVNAKLFEKGISLFSDDVQQQLNRHLLRTVCTDITNAIFSYYATISMVTVDDSSITPEVRSKILSALPDDKAKQILTRLQGSLQSAKGLDDFFVQLESVCGPGNLEISLKIPEKKKERKLIFNHRQSLVEQLKAESDPAMALHLCVTLLVLVHAQCMIYAPGRCVPQIVAFLKDHMTGDQHRVLVECQDLVMKRLKQSSDASSAEARGDDGESEISAALGDLLPKVKDIALNAKRAGSVQDDA